MAREIMERRAAENTYLHKDFHGALNHGMIYLQRHFGDEAVREWLRDFTRQWHAPLRQRLAAGDLDALRRHLEDLHRSEGVAITCEKTPDALLVRVPACPAVSTLRQRGEAICDLFVETTRTVNEALCEGTPFQAELLAYDPATGASLQRFSRRTP